MHKSLRKPVRVAGYLALALLLAFSVLMVSCTEKRDATTAPDRAAALTAAGLERVMAVQNRHTDEVMAIDGVVGTGTGLSASGKPVVKVFAERESVAGIPATLDGVPVEVEVTGKFEAFALTGQYRPVPIGVSVGNNDECASGTIGCVVTKAGASYILSNNHVLARENAAAIGSDIVQPGRFDNKPKCANEVATDQVADLSAFVPIVFSTTASNTVDAAIAQFTPSTAFSCATLAGFYGTPSSTTVTATVGLAIKKVGRTTELTTGTVTAINATVNIGYSSGTARFVNQIVTSSGFSRSGDSGSLVVTNNAGSNPVGLLFAGTNNGTTICNPIGNVLSAFGVTICGN
jgi:hypothetical protein